MNASGVDIRIAVTATQRARVLWVGRMQFSSDVRVRETELARHIARSADLFALDRSDAMPREPQGLTGKIKMRQKLWNCATLVLEERPITRFRMRVAGATGPVFNRLAAGFNARQLERAVRRFKCTHVFLSLPFFFLTPPSAQRDYRVHFDLVDNFHDEWPPGIVGNSRRRFVRESMANADTLTASSHSLCEHAERISGRQAAWAPNGAPMERFARFGKANGDNLRESLGLQDRFVVGFIGNHLMDFDGMATLLEAFVAARKSRPELALLIVGPGADKLAGPRGLGREQGVWAVGPVTPDEVPAWFLACDAGVHPYDPRPLTHDATPLNVIEFSACGKPMLCNPLRELQRLALPNVRFTADGSVESWAAALADVATFSDFDRDALATAIEPFRWERSAEIVRKEMGI